MLDKSTVVLRRVRYGLFLHIIETLRPFSTRLSLKYEWSLCKISCV